MVVLVREKRLALSFMCIGHDRRGTRKLFIGTRGCDRVLGLPVATWMLDSHLQGPEVATVSSHPENSSARRLPAGSQSTMYLIRSQIESSCDDDEASEKA
ncbi:hypothetical protein AKJ16_DCAP02144 [Drosera capensis]